MGTYCEQHCVEDEPWRLSRKEIKSGKRLPENICPDKQDDDEYESDASKKSRPWSFIDNVPSRSHIIAFLIFGISFQSLKLLMVSCSLNKIYRL